ncbi:MAG: MBL fold metallo-hydrolase [Roseibium sp.]|nr:MBL fold metallo-hydrolase [Roseibium sp.]
MSVTFDVLVPGSSLAFEGGFFGLSSIVLITTPHSRILFDCGHGSTRQMLLSALAARALTPAKIDQVVLSHGHFDHVLNLDLFPDATVVMSRDEHAYIQAPFEHDTLTHRFLPRILEGHRLELTDGERELAPGVRLFPSPGHSPGHISLQLDTSDGPVVLAADALKTAREALSGVPDLELDPEKRGAASLQEVLRRGRIIVPGHHPVLTQQEDGRLTWTDVQDMPLRIR